MKIFSFFKKNTMAMAVGPGGGSPPDGMQSLHLKN